MASYKDTQQLDLFVDSAFSTSPPPRKRPPISEETRRKMAAARRGRKWSEADKRKMSESRKRYLQTLSEEERSKQRERRKGRTGPNSSHWKGGKTMTPCKTCHIPFPVKPYLVGKVKYCSIRCRREDPDKKSALHKRIRASVEYKAWRKAVFERDNWTCQMCSGRGGILQADHIKPFALFPELRFEVSNGRTLCIDCHSKTDTYGVYTWRRKAFLLQQVQEETPEP